MRAEPWFFVGVRRTSSQRSGLISWVCKDEMREEFLRHHADLLTADYWRGLKATHIAERHLEVVPYTTRRALAAPGTA